MSFRALFLRIIFPFASFLGVLWLAMLFSVSLFELSPGKAVFLHEVAAYSLLGILTLLVICGLLILLLISWIALKWFFTRIRRRIDGEAAASEARAVSLLIALAVTTVLFASALTEFSSVLVQFLRAFIINAPSDIGYMFVEGTHCISSEVWNFSQTIRSSAQGSTEQIETPIRMCLPDFIATAANTLHLIFSDAIDALQQFDVLRLLLAAVVFFASLYAVEYIVTSRRRHAKFWAGYASLTGVAIYLAVSATLSVAVLQDAEDNPTTLTSVMLADDIDSLGFRQPDITLLKIDPQKLDIFSDAQWLPEMGPAVAGLLDQLGEIAAGVGPGEVEFNEAANRASNHYKRIKALAVGSFDHGGSAISNRNVAQQHYNDLKGWYIDQANLFNESLVACANALNFRIHLAEKWSARLDSIRASSSLQSLETAVASAWSDANDDLGYLWDKSQGACTPTAYIQPPPSSGALTASLGIVGASSSWLLDTGSKPVTLIIGLLGYGLLGALISRFVMPGAADFEITSGLEFWLVAVRGFIAALIVFIASFGGLQIIAENSATPDPYSVFALCLAGAAFSDKVWNSLRDRLSGYVSGDAAPPEILEDELGQALEMAGAIEEEAGGPGTDTGEGQDTEPDGGKA